MTIKKLLIFLSILILMSAGGFFAWKYGQKQKPEVVNQEQGEQQQAPAQNSVEYLTAEEVIEPILAYDNLSIWFFDTSGNLLRQHLSDKNDLKQYPLPEHEDISWVLWPDSGSDFIIGTQAEKYWYDSRSDKFIPYPDAVKYIVWLPGGNRVAYIWSDEQNTGLYTALPSLSDFGLVTALPHSGYRIMPSPNGQSFVLFSGSGDMPLYRVIKGIGVMEPISSNLAVTGVKFSPSGNDLAFVESRDGNSYLNILNISDRSIKMVGTIGEGYNFTWSQDASSLAWPDTIGRLQLYDIESGVLEELDTEIKSVRARSVIPGRDNKEFFFLEKDSGRLGRILLQ